MKLHRRLVLKISSLLIFVVLIFTSCKSVETQSSATVSVTSTKVFISPSSTSVPSFTPSVTLTAATHTPTLVPDQYPSLSDLALTIEDIPEDSQADSLLFLNSSYEKVLPLVYDMTEELVLAGDCYLDCDKKVWVNGKFKITLILIRRSDSEEAQQASQDRCFELFPSRVHQPSKYDDCLFAMKMPIEIPNTWAFDKYFGGRYGAINFFADMDHIGGDDGTIYQLILTEIVKLQVAKFVQAGIPSVP